MPPPNQVPHIGHRRLLAERGIMNPFNNCWSNSVLQVLCSSVIYNTIPEYNNCPIAVCKYLHKINKDLRFCTEENTYAKGALTLTLEIRELIKQFYHRDQKYDSLQDDAADYLQAIVAHLCENSTNNTHDHFQSRTVNITFCTNCKQYKATEFWSIRQLSLAI